MSPLLNIFSLHYFLWFAALTSIYGFISVYAEHYANASSSQYGLLNMILPFVTIVAKIFFCSLADRHRAYRSFFIWFLIASLIGFGSFGVLPFFITPQPKENGLNYGIWSLICLMTAVATISMSVMSCLSDAFAMNSSKKNNSSYGFIRVWGTLGWGASSIAIAFINQIGSLPLLVPGLILTIILLVLDIFAAIFWPNKEDFTLEKSSSNIQFEDLVSVLAKEKLKLNTDDSTRLTESKTTTQDTQVYGTTEMRNVNSISQDLTNQSQQTQTPATQQHEQLEVSDTKTQWILFKEVAKRRKSLFRYMTLFTISGALISLQWSYFFLYLNKIYPKEFTFITGLSMVGQSFLGELPFFIISQPLIQILGRSHTLSISIISIGLRYLLYEFLLPNSSMYFVLLTEPFQGPNFGLFYVVMTEVGLDYSDCEEVIVEIVRRGIVPNNPDKVQQLRLALRATMQSVMSACYEGLGLGIGSIIGGLVIDYYGFSDLWIWASIIAITLGLANFIIDLLNLPILVDKKPNLEIWSTRQVNPIGLEIG